MTDQHLLPIVLQIIGVMVIIAEVILPSGGILSILAIGVMGFSLFKAFSVSSNTGMVFLWADIIIVPILVIMGLKLIAKSPLALRKTLSKEDGVMSQRKDLEILLNESGIAITNLRPAGSIRIKNKKIDAVTEGGYIDKGTPVCVVQVTGNQVIVKKE